MSAEGIPTEWYFITSPQDVSWTKDSVTKEVATYGTNNPYLNYGTTKLRKLQLGNAMVEGFSNAMQVEDNIIQLEACMRMIIEESTGYASPYCWVAYAESKSYGTFIITSVKVKEEMRDMTGNATRAYVDIELQEVPPYQVSSGTDITSTASVGGFDPKFVEGATSQTASQDKAVAEAKSGPTGYSDDGSTYTVSGVTYDAATGRPVGGQNIVEAQDRYQVAGTTYDRASGRPVAGAPSSSAATNSSSPKPPDGVKGTSTTSAIDLS